MFGSIGGPEMLLILVVALLVFGPRKLPQLGKTLGKAMGEFRRASHEFRSTLEREIDAEETPAPPRPAPVEAAHDPEPGPDPDLKPGPEA